MFRSECPGCFEAGTQVPTVSQRYVAGCCGSSSPKTMENQAAMKLIAIDPCPNDNFWQL